MIIRRTLWLALIVGLMPGAVFASETQALAEQANRIMQNRCMVCHGCYDAPCQLKLEADAGLRRGASKALVYDGTRLTAANMTRLFDDALTEAQWRDKGFFPYWTKRIPGTARFTACCNSSKPIQCPQRDRYPKASISHSTATSSV